jgi:hypothetical protein
MIWLNKARQLRMIGNIQIEVKETEARKKASMSK